MVNLLDQAVEVARRLPLHNQNEIAHIILQLAGDNAAAAYQLSPDEQSALNTSKAQAARGDFASDEDIEAIWNQ